MADKKVSDLPLIDITAVQSNNILLLVDLNEPLVGDRNKSIDLNTLFQYINNQLAAAGEGVYLVQGANATQEGYFNVVHTNRLTGNTTDGGSLIQVDEGTILSLRQIQSPGPISIAAGGSNQNIEIAPSGSGNLILNTGGVVQVRAAANGFRIYNSTNNFFVDFNAEAISGNRRIILADGTTSLVPGTMVPTSRTLGISTENGLTGGVSSLDLSSNRSWTLGLTGQALAFHNLATTGLVVRSGTNTVITREITVSGSGLSISNGTAVSGNPLISINSTALNTANAIVLRDASGNFAAGTITAALSGNATTSTTLETARLINGTSFNGSANITTASWGTSRTISIGGTAKSVDGSGNVTWTTAELAAQTAIALATARQINGSLFDGTEDITTATWGTARNITIGGTTRSVNGSTTYNWSLADIGVNNATLTLNATGIATGSQSWTSNQGTNATFTVNVPGTNLSFTSGTTTGPTINSSTGTGAAIPAASGTASGVVTTDTQTFAGVKTFLSPISGSLGGNASTATALQTARLINGVSFNGTADITITAATPQTLTRGAYLTGNSFNGSAATTWAVDATTDNTASKVVVRDASGNFAAGTITASLSGNASTATLASNINRQEVTTANNNFYRVLLGADNNLTGSSPAYVVTNANRLFYNPSTDTLSVGTLSGNATSASILTTSRTIWGQSFNGSANVTGALTGVTDITASGTLASNRLSLAAGSVGAPSLFFTGDDNTGLWSPGADTVAFSAGGAERLRIDSSGRLLVGTSTSIDTRNYLNNSYGGPSIQQHGVTQAASVLAVYNWTNGSGAPAGLTLSKSLGNAIGTRGALTAANQDIGAITFTGDDGTNFIPAAAILTEVDGTPAANSMPGRLVFSTTADGASSPTERLRIDSAGRVGIGTSSPDQILDLQATGTASGGGPFIRLTDAYAGAWTANSDSSGIEFFSADTSGPGIAVRSKIANTVEDTTGAGQALTFWTTANSAGQSLTERLRIDSSGRLLVGGSSDTSNGGTNQLLQIINTAGGRMSLSRNDTAVVAGELLGAIDFRSFPDSNWRQGATITSWADADQSSTSVPTRLVLSTTADGASSPTERLRIDSAGRVGIGTNSPSFLLHVAGSALIGENSSNGNLRVSTNNNSQLSIYSDSASTITIEAFQVDNINTKHNLHFNKYGGYSFFGHRVGIGTSTPSQSLQVVGNVVVGATPAAQYDNLTVVGSSGIQSASPLFNLVNAAGSTRFGYINHTGAGGDIYILNQENGALRFGTNNTERVRLDSSGKLLIGTSIVPNVGLLNVLGDITLATNGTTAGRQATYALGVSDSGTVGHKARIAFEGAGTNGFLTNITFSNFSGDFFNSALVERARIDSSGRLLVGTSSAITGTSGIVDLVQVNGAFAVRAYSANQFGNRIQFTKSRNATTGSHTVVQSGDILGYLEWAGSDGTDFDVAARITAEVDGEPATAGDTTDMPGRLVFSTTADGASSPTERLRIDSSGRVGIGTSSPNAVLTVNNPTNASPTGDFGGLFISSVGATVGQGNLGGAISFSRINTTRRGAMIASVESGADTDQQGLAFFTRGITTTANDDVAERVRIDDQGRLLVGTSSAGSNYNYQAFAGETPFGQLVSASRVTLLLQRTNGAGSLILANAQSVANGNQIGVISFNHTDGTNFIPAASIDARVDGDPAANDMPGRLIFSTTADGASSPTERLRITSDGYVRLAAGTVGIQFNGDTAAANALDDYEEGTWTPEIADAISGGNVGTATVYGYYVKVGSWVALTLSIVDINTSGMTTGNDLFIRNLPFTAASLAGTNLYTGALIAASLAVAKSPVLAIVDNSAYIRIAETEAGAALDYLTIGEITSGATDLYGTVSYQAV